MERENRYLVLKRKDIESCLTGTEKAILGAIASKVAMRRVDNGKGFLEVVVVESDWPEYEKTWQAIAARVDGKPQAIHKEQ